VSSNTVLLAGWRVSKESPYKRLIGQVLFSLPGQRTLNQNQFKSCWSKWVSWCDKQQVDQQQQQQALFA